MANMMYDVMTELPPRGSVREALMVSIRLRKDVQDLYRTYVMVQAVRDKSETGEPSQDAFNKFKDAIMPFTSDTTRQADQDVVKRLEQEIARGPLRVRRVMETPRIRSRLQSIARRTAKMGPLGR
jgi:hypothetical protein